MRRRKQALLVVLLGTVVLVGAVLVLLQQRARSGDAPAPLANTPPEMTQPAQDARAIDDVVSDPPAAAARVGLRSLFGEVSDPSGHPIMGATVTATLEDGATEARASDGEGAFALDGLRAAILRVTFSAPGYRDANVDSASLPAVAEAHWSQKLTPAFADGAGRIEGVVVDDRGFPVTAYRLLSSPGGAPIERPRGRQSRSVVAEVSDANGAFSRELTGPLALVVIATGFRPSDELVVEVEPGHVEHLRIVLERSNALTGRVSNAVTGAPIADAIVALDRVRGVEPALTDENGRYRIASLPREKASVLVRAEGFNDLTLGGVEGGRSRDEVLDVTLTPRSPAGRDGAAATTEVVGIGVGVSGGPDGVQVSEVFANGPAHGVLERGDVIIEVDGVSLRGKPLREGMSAIRGESGSTIHLRVLRKDGSSKSVSMERARVSIPEG